MAYTPIPKGFPDWDEPLNAALADQDTRITDNTFGVSALVTSVSNIQTNVTQLQADVVALDGRLDAAETNVTTLQGQMATANSNISTLQSQMTTANSNIATNTSNIATNTSNITTLQGQMTTANSNISTLQGQMTTANSNISTLQGQMTTANANIAANSSDILDLAREFDPDDYGFKAWTQDPATCAVAQANASGQINFALIKVTKTITANNVIFNFDGAHSGGVAGQNFVGIYNDSLTRLAVSADQTTAFNGAAERNITVPMISPPVLTPGYYYIAILTNATTQGTIMGGGNALQTGLNVNITSRPRTMRTIATTNTSLPASTTFGAMELSGNLRWYGIT